MAASSKFLESLQNRTLLCDGAMGTMLYQAGVFVNRCFDELNLTDGPMIRQVHEAYIKAGADIIETNTFGANRFKLEKFGLEKRIVEINRLAVEHASEAVAGRNVFILGSVGPLGRPIIDSRGIDPHQAFDAFVEQITSLVDAGVDGIILETFSQMDDMEIALKAARDVSETIPIVGQFSFADEHSILGGGSVRMAVRLLEDLGADVVGANCALGPRVLLDVVTHMVSLTDLPVSVQPNAGRPEYVDGRLIYFATPDYFAKFAKRFTNAGASIVGGCCGTTPEHIRTMSGSVRALGKQKEEVVRVKPMQEHELLAEVEMAVRSPFGKRLVDGEFVISVEIDPPKGLSLEKTVAGARKLKAAGVHVANIADGPRASARISAQSMGLILENEVGLESILHVSCRDRNLLGLQSDLLGAHISGFRNVLAVTGDPPIMGDYPSATGVFDVDAIGLISLLKNLNQGIDMGGRSMNGQSSFVIGVAANPAAQNLPREMDRLERKAAAGGEFIMTQPIYDSELLDKFLNEVAHLNLPVMAGILPLASSRNAEFLHNEVPGMTIPDSVRQRMLDAGENGAREGIAIAREMFQQVKQTAQGVYIMPPFSRFSTVLEVIG